MNNYTIPLSKVPISKKAKVKKIILDGPIRRRLLDLGLIEDTIVEVLQKSPFGDPIAYLIRGAVIALRSEITSNILIEIV
jgi:ferrous iron transport protein A